MGEGVLGFRLFFVVKLGDTGQGHVMCYWIRGRTFRGQFGLKLLEANQKTILRKRKITSMEVGK
jgi:hypothetical protein